METNIYENQDIIWNKKIKLYKEIFWENPWDEWFICINCNSIFSKNFMWKCNCEKPTIEPFYKNSQLKNNFSDLSKKLWYTELVAKILDNNVWFIWWWKTNIDEINDEKFWLDKNNLNELVNWIYSIFPDFDLENFYYFAEIGVKNEFRWNDIAWNLYRENLEKLKENWYKYKLVRTTKKTDIPFKWFLKEWYKEVFSYNDEQDRVILAYKI
jgi:hypothetical protein